MRSRIENMVDGGRAADLRHPRADRVGHQHAGASLTSAGRLAARNHVTEIVGIQSGIVPMHDIFEFQGRGVDLQGHILG
jgi:hypothetical protein